MLTLIELFSEELGAGGGGGTFKPGQLSLYGLKEAVISDGQRTCF